MGNLLEECQLLVKGLNWPLARRGSLSTQRFVIDPIFLPKTRDQLRDAFTVRIRKKRTFLITLAIILHQVREMLGEKRKENRRRTWLQE